MNASVNIMFRYINPRQWNPPLDRVIIYPGRVRKRDFARENIPPARKNEPIEERWIENG